MTPLQYYSNKQVQKQIYENSKDKEISYQLSNKGFGKRPDILQFENDILELAKQGATSFHISEENWHDPLKLEPGMPKTKLDQLRKSWDLILDIDGPFEYSQIASNLLIEALRFHNITNIPTKFSGNKGFHIAIPFTSFPKEVNNRPTPLLFPEGPKIIASYLSNLIKEPLTARLLEKYTIEEIQKTSKKTESEIIKDGKFNPFSVVDIDTILISNRHMFRAPYSLHEKSNLASIPINPSNILNFKKEQANPENIKEYKPYLNIEPTPNQAKELFIQAFDWHQKNKPKEETKKEYTYEEIKDEIHEKFFPPCIKLILQGIASDGRKRALFILLNFLKSTGHKKEKIQEIIQKWNKDNYEPLKEGYIQAQLNWHTRNQQKILPPNCSNNNYYTSLLVCKPDQLCSKVKNPVNYAVRKSRFKVNKKQSNK